MKHLLPKILLFRPLICFCQTRALKSYLKDTVRCEIQLDTRFIFNRMEGYEIFVYNKNRREKYTYFIFNCKTGHCLVPKSYIFKVIYENCNYYYPNIKFKKV